MGVTTTVKEGALTRIRVYGCKLAAERLKVTDGRARQLADSTDRWAALVAKEMGTDAETILRRFLARDPEIVELDVEGRAVGLVGVAARIHSDPELRRKSRPGVKGGPLEYASAFPLVGRRVTDLLRDHEIAVEGVNAEREWTFGEESLLLFEEVERRERGNPDWIARRGEGSGGEADATE